MQHNMVDVVIATMLWPQVSPYPAGQAGSFSQALLPEACTVGASCPSPTGAFSAFTYPTCRPLTRPFVKQPYKRSSSPSPAWYSERRDTVIALLKLAEENRMVLVRSPSQTGKTSLLQLVRQLVQDSCELGWKHVAAISMFSTSTLK